MWDRILERRSVLACGWMTLFSLATGCNGLWDDMTSRDFWKAENWGRQPEPLEVLRDSRDGDKRHRALLRLGTVQPGSVPPEEAEAILQVLCTSAVSERQPWVRLAAVKALGNWNDPRAAEALRDAYYRSSAFPGEAGAALRSQTLTALGRCGHPSAADILVKVLREPPVEGSETERQQKLEERLAAARALGHYSNPQVTTALVEVLRKEKDPGLRCRAHESLVRVTGKDLPADAEAWDQYLIDPNSAPDRSLPQRLQEILPAGWRRD